MGKKQRRKQQPSWARAQVSAPVAAEPAQQSSVAPELRRSTAAAPTFSRTRPGATWLEFREQYRHVNAELKQIGIIAASFLVVLLVLAAILS